MSGLSRASEGGSTMSATPDLDVTVDDEPAAGLLRPAIEAALTGRDWPPGPEAAVAAEVARAVGEAVRARGEGPGDAPC